MLWTVNQHTHIPKSGRKLTSRRDFLSSSSNTNNNRLSPTLVASLQGSAHDTNVTCAVESVVQTTVSDLDEVVLNGLSDLGWVDEFGRAELLCPLLLAIVDIHHDDALSTVLDRTLDHRESNTPGAEYSDAGALLYVRGDNGSTIPSGDTASKQTSPVHGGVLSNSNDRDIGGNGVLRESRASHKVEQILSLTLEPRGSIGHHTASLGSTDLSAKVCFSRLAELALLALGGVEGDNVVADFDVVYVLANGLDDSGPLVSEDNGKGAFGVLAGEGVCIYEQPIVSVFHPIFEFSS